jgi:hypothetical protein
MFPFENGVHQYTLNSRTRVGNGHTLIIIVNSAGHINLELPNDVPSREKNRETLRSSVSFPILEPEFVNV